MAPFYPVRWVAPFYPELLSGRSAGLCSCCEEPTAVSWPRARLRRPPPLWGRVGVGGSYDWRRQSQTNRCCQESTSCSTEISAICSPAGKGNGATHQGNGATHHRVPQWETEPPIIGCLSGKRSHPSSGCLSGSRFFLTAMAPFYPVRWVAPFYSELLSGRSAGLCSCCEEPTAVS